MNEQQILFTLYMLYLKYWLLCCAWRSCYRR